MPGFLRIKDPEVIDNRAFVEQMSNEFQKGEYADLEIHVDGHVFKVIKALLCIKSPVFKAMFNNDTEERRTNTVKINDFGRDAVEIFLRFFYTGSTKESMGRASEIYPIADYYDVSYLREACITEMYRNLTTDNVSECYKLADKFNLSDLKKKAIDFLCKQVGHSTIYDLYQSSIELDIDKLKNQIKSFIELNLLDISITPIWQKFDEKFRLEMHQSYMESRNKSSFKNVGMENLLLSIKQVSERTQTRFNEKDYFQLSFELKNNGNYELYYNFSSSHALIVGENYSGKITQSSSTELSILFEKPTKANLNIRSNYSDPNLLEYQTIRQRNAQYYNLSSVPQPVKVKSHDFLYNGNVAIDGKFFEPVPEAKNLFRSIPLYLE